MNHSPLGLGRCGGLAAVGTHSGAGAAVRPDCWPAWCSSSTRSPGVGFRAADGLLWASVLVRLLVPIAPPSSFSLQKILPSAEPATDRVRPRNGVVRSQSERRAQSVRCRSRRIEVDGLRPLPTSSVDRGTTLLGLPCDLVNRCERNSFVDGDRPLAILPHAQAGDRQRRGTGAASLGAVLPAGRHSPRDSSGRLRRSAAAGCLRPLSAAFALAAGRHRIEGRAIADGDAARVVHVRGRHVAANWLLVLVRAVHWWNPVSWLAATRYRNLREQSCDAFALSQIAGRPVREYGELLLELAQSRPAGRAWNVMLPASILGFLSTFLRKRALANRLKRAIVRRDRPAHGSGRSR